MPTVTRSDLVFDVHEWGPADGEPVLMLHGSPQRGTSWAAVAARLVAGGYRVLAPDQRGYSPGGRPPARGAYTSSSLVGDAIAVIDQLVGPDARVHLVGHDWGAFVAWRLAARHPERVTTLTAVSVPPPAAYARSLVTSRQLLASWYLFAFQVPGLAERLFAPGAHPYSRRLAAGLRRGGQSRDAARRDAAGLADPAALVAALNWYRAMFLERAADPPISVPTLFVWSDGDTAVTRAAIELTHRYVTGPFRYAELRGVSHWIPDEAPDDLAELILDHISG